MGGLDGVDPETVDELGEVEPETVGEVGPEVRMVGKVGKLGTPLIGVELSSCGVVDSKCGMVLSSFLCSGVVLSCLGVVVSSFSCPGAVASLP